MYILLAAVLYLFGGFLSVHQLKLRYTASHPCRMSARNPGFSIHSFSLLCPVKCSITLTKAELQDFSGYHCKNRLTALANLLLSMAMLEVVNSPAISMVRDCLPLKVKGKSTCLL